MSQSAGYFQYYNSGERATRVRGVDIARYQYLNPGGASYGEINFNTMYNAGARFILHKAGGVYGTFNARYIRCTVNGSYTNTSSIFNEVKVWKSGTNLAAGKTVTGSAGSPQSGAYANVTDGNTANFVIVGDNSQYVQIDLGAVYTSIQFVEIWHYYADGRKFKDNKIEYSSDGSTWTTLFLANAGNGLEYNETSAGAQIYPYTGVSADPMFTAAHISAARAAGLKVGAYWFKNPNHFSVSNNRFMNTIADAEAEATQFYNYVVNQLGSASLDCFAMLDWENQNGNMTPFITNDQAYDFIEAFCNKYKQLSGGRQVGLYTAFYTIDSLTATSHGELVHSTKGGLDDVCPLWLSATNTSYPDYAMTAFGGFPSDKWTVWQYNYVNGLATTYGCPASGDIDLDVLDGTDISVLMPPSQVTGLTGNAASESATISWNAPADTDITKYRVYIDDVMIAEGVTTGATITGMTNGTTYKIEISAVDAWEEGTKSDPIYLTPESGTIINVVPYIPVTETGAVVFYQASSEGDEFENDGKTVVMVKNDSGADISVSIDSIKPDNYGNDHNLQVTVAAGTIKVIGGFSSRRFNRPSGRIKMTYSSFTDISIMVAKFRKSNY